MKKIFSLSILFFCTSISFAQKALDVINKAEVLRIENYLASDELKGRKPGTPGIDKAADFIANEFKNYGLKFGAGETSYKQNFTFVKTKYITASGFVEDRKSVV